MHIVACLAVLVLLALATLAMIALAARHQFQAVMTLDVVKLCSGPAPKTGPRELAALRESLSESVRCHLRLAIPEGAPAIGIVCLKHEGLFQTDPDGRWFRIHGEQYFMWHILASRGMQESGQHPCCGSKPATASSLAGETCL